MDFLSLISASFSCRFRLLLSSYGRLFVKFLFTKITDNTVAGAFSLKTTKRAFYVLVFSYFNRGHSFFTNLCRCIYRLPRNYNNLTTRCQAFFKGFTRFFPFISAYFVEICLYCIFSKSEAGCLHQGQIKSSGSGPSCTYPQTLHTHFSCPPCCAWGLGLILL